MNQQIQAALQERINQFASDITQILTGAVADAVDESLRGSTGRGSAGGARRGPGRPPKAAGGAKRGPGRPSKSNVDLDTILAAVGKKSDGMRMEELLKIVGGKANNVRPAVHKLIKAKKLTKKGQARGVRYFAK